MNGIRRALRPVKRRLRRIRVRRGAALGVLLGGISCLAIMAASFFVPIREKTEVCGIALAAWMLALTLANLLRPVPDLLAARTADAHGLRERAQTAMCHRGETQMEQLQWADARDALARFDVRSIALPGVRRTLLCAALSLAAAGALLLVPNPQNAAIRRAEAFEAQMEEAAAQVEAEAEQIDGGMSEKDRQELRRLLTDLSRELREADDEMEAMVSIGKAQERLEALRNGMAGEALARMSDALNAQGMDALAQALAEGDEQSLSEALQSVDAQALNRAAQQLDGEVQGMMAAAAQALNSGDAQGALGALSGLQSQAQSGMLSPAGSASQLLSSLRAGAASAGQGGQQSASDGQSGSGSSQGSPSASGAGSGSTNQDQSGSPGSSGQSGEGTGNPRYREAEYERIYDPTRIDAGQTELSAHSEEGEGESIQMQLGPGAGALGDSVPYNQVVYEYAEAAAKAADSQNLTAQERSWVNAYFAALTQE
ncbi:MAG: hypothetical protein ACI4MF_13400 [Candidatus Faecivicinus sp.]